MFLSHPVKLQVFYATFGTGQTYAGHYVEIHAEDYEAAYECMHTNHGYQWAELYPAAMFEAGGHIAKYDYVKLATVVQKSMRDDGRLIFLARR